MPLASPQTENDFFTKPITEKEMEALKKSSTYVYKGFNIVHANDFINNIYDRKVTKGDRLIYLAVDQPGVLVEFSKFEHIEDPTNDDKYETMIILKRISDGKNLTLNLGQYFEDYIILYIVNIYNTDQYWPGHVIRAPNRPENGRYSVDHYVRKHILNLNVHRVYDEQQKKWVINSNRGKMGGVHFPNSQNAYFKDHGYVRVEKPKLNDNLVYVEVEGPTIEVKLTKQIDPTKGNPAMYYELSPIYNGEPFRVDQADNRVEYFLLKKAVTASRNNHSRMEALSSGHGSNNTRVKGGFRSQRASRRSVTRR
jgi:hypothetical protein